MKRSLDIGIKDVDAPVPAMLLTWLVTLCGAYLFSVLTCPSVLVFFLRHVYVHLPLLHIISFMDFTYLRFSVQSIKFSFLTTETDMS